MKTKLLNYIICPECSQNQFDLTIFKKNSQNNEIINGLICCQNCLRPYIIKDNILILLPDQFRRKEFDVQFSSLFKESLNYFKNSPISYNEINNDIIKVQKFWDDHVCGGIWQNNKEQFEEVRRHRYKIYPWLKNFHEFENYSNSCILEVGCGQGVDLCEYALHSRNEFYGIGADLSFNSLKIANQRSFYYNISDKLDFILTCANNLPFKKELFDLSYALGSLHHSPGTINSLHNVLQTVKIGGDFKFMVYAKCSLNHFLHIILRFLEKIFSISFLIKKLSVAKEKDSMAQFKKTGKSAIIHAPYANHFWGFIMKKIFSKNFEKARIERRTIFPTAKIDTIFQEFSFYNPLEKLFGYQLCCIFIKKHNLNK